MDRRVDEDDADEVLLNQLRDERHDLRLLGATGPAEIIRIDPDLNGTLAKDGKDGPAA